MIIYWRDYFYVFFSSTYIKFESKLNKYKFAEKWYIYIKRERDSASAIHSFQSYYEIIFFWTMFIRLIKFLGKYSAEKSLLLNIITWPSILNIVIFVFLHLKTSFIVMYYCKIYTQLLVHLSCTVVINLYKVIQL